MKYICALSMVLFIASELQAQINYFEVSSPKPNQVVGSSLSISLAVASPNGIKQVTASVGSIHMPLAVNPQDLFYETNIDLTSLPQDSIQLILIATDSLNITDTVIVPIIYDLPPNITVDSPINWSVARPMMHIRARCSDNSPHCTIVVTSNMGGSRDTPYGTFQDSLNTIIDLSPYDGNSGYLVFTAIDRYNQQALASRQVFAESSPYLQEIYGGADQILDFNYNKVSIFKQNPNIGPNYRENFIQDISTKDSVPIRIPNPTSLQISPYGALAISVDTNIIDTYHFYDWNNDSLYYYPFAPSTFKTAGDYACMNNFSGNLTIRNLKQKSDTTLYPVVSSTLKGYDLSSDGSIVFGFNDENYNPNIFKYKNGITQKITNNTNDDINLLNPLTDGNLVVYTKGNVYGSSPANYIYLQAGDSSILLSNLGQTELYLYSHLYEVNNGFIVYSVPDSSGSIQLWRRDSVGNISQVTHGSINNQLELIDSHGDFTFTGAPSLKSYRYFSSISDSVQKVSSFLGTAYFRNNSYYIAIGRMLYQLNVHIPPNTIDNSVINTSRDSVYRFRTTDFTNQFQGPGALMQVQITSLPAHGVLYYSGVAVTQNQQIPRSNLSNLTYQPDSIFLQDSIGWNGSNGINYTHSSGVIILSDGKHLPIPVVSGLQSTYCSSQGSEKIKILNPPATNSGYTETVLLDNNNLTIANDSSFQIPLSTMSEGAHIIQVTYSNTLNSQQLKDTFLLTKAVTPSIRLSANPQTISNTNSSVLITVNFSNGGGANPQYSFAKDSSFSNILQGPGALNLLTISGSTLQPGNNWFYARMQTSDSCYTQPFVTDSINIKKVQANGLIDPDFPDQQITIYPNPFLSRISMSGLQLTKSYSISLMDVSGHRVAKQSISNSEVATISKSNIPAGVYLLKLYDETKGRAIGTISLLKQ